MKLGLAAIFWVALCVFAIVFGPFLLVWSINTLFGLAIAYTLKAWAAAAVIGSLIGARGSKP
jgi:hypothetical protein